MDFILCFFFYHKLCIIAVYLDKITLFYMINMNTVCGIILNANYSVLTCILSIS